MQKLLTRRWALLIVQCLVVVAWPVHVQAYCQATSVQASLVCPSSCIYEGLPVAWATPEIEYAFNMRGFPGLDDAAVRAAIASSFAAWENVTCDGRPLGFHFAELAETTDLTVGPLEDEPNLNVISLLSAAEWRQFGFAPAEFARTKVWVDEKTGEIVGADIAFNGALMPLAVCPDEGSCDPDAVDLQNVATHEIGHFLGLAHSTDPSATMWCAAERGDHEKRTLAPDDELGLCATYESGAAFLDPLVAPATSNRPVAHQAASCSIASVHSTRTHTPWLTLFLVLIATRVARRVAREMLLTCRLGEDVTMSERTTAQTRGICSVAAASRAAATIDAVRYARDPHLTRVGFSPRATSYSTSTLCPNVTPTSRAADYTSPDCL